MVNLDVPLRQTQSLLATRLVGVLDAPVIAAVCRADPADAVEVLTHLATHGSVHPVGPAGVSAGMPAEYTVGVIEPAWSPGTEADELVRRWATHLLAVAEDIRDRLTPWKQAPHRALESESAAAATMADRHGERELVEWLHRRSGDLRAAVTTCHNRGWHALTVALVAAIEPLLIRRRPANVWAPLVAGYGLPSSTALSDQARAKADVAAARRMRVYMLTAHGAALRHLDRHQRALDYYARARKLAGQDLPGVAMALDGVGATHLAAGRADLAGGPLTEALVICQKLGDRHGAATARTRLGQLACGTGQVQQALALLREAHQDLTALRDQYGAARSGALLGLALVRAGHRDHGEKHLCAALEGFDRAGSPPGVVQTTEWLAQVTRDTDAAYGLWRLVRSLRLGNGRSAGAGEGPAPTSPSRSNGPGPAPAGTRESGA